MRRSDRLARLHELLARVQRNAAERRGEVAASASGSSDDAVHGSFAGEPIDPPPARVLRAHLEPIPPPPASAADLVADDWSSLFARELSDPSPHAETTGETSFPSLIPPDPPPISEPTALAADRMAVEEEPVEPAPESALERAVRIATEQRPQPPDPRALWLEAAEELRERRITVPPEDEPVADAPHVAEPRSAPPSATARRSTRPAPESHTETPTPIATFETTHTPASRAFESVAPSPMSRRRRPARPSPTPVEMAELPAEKPTPYWAVVLLGCGVGLLFTLAYVAFRALDEPHAVAQAVPNATFATTATTTATPLPSAPSAVSAPSLPVASSTPVVSSDPPLPVIKRPKDMGLLWVDSTVPVSVYVQGLPAGESGTYLEVPCGLKNVRLARRDLPPPGHSFPMWLGKAESVLVPCGAANRVKMAPE